MTNFKPARLNFEDLLWPKDAQSLFTLSLADARYGKPFYLSRFGQREPNYIWLAYYFARENGVKYSEETNEFCYFDTNGGTWNELSPSVLNASVLEFLAALGSNAGFEWLRQRMTVADRKRIISELRTVTLYRFPRPTSSVKDFVAQCVEPHDASDVTVAELYGAYRQFSINRQISILGQREFQKKLTGEIAKRHGITRSHSIRRSGANPRGFRNLRLKLSLVCGDTTSPVSSDHDIPNKQHEHNYESGTVGRYGTAEN